MQILTVLFLVVFLSVVGFAIFFGLSFAFGSELNSRTGSRAEGRDLCAQYDADNEWFQALPSWQQSAAMVWWWVNRYQCNSKGC